MRPLALQILGVVIVLAMASGALAQAPTHLGTHGATLHTVQPSSYSHGKVGMPNPWSKPHHWWGRPWWGNPYWVRTPAESYMVGKAALVRAQGQYNLLSSQAAIATAEARRREIDNKAKFAEDFHALRRLNRAARDAEQGPRITQEIAARLAEQGRPAPLEGNELDARTGTISWPAFLQAEQFAGYRAELDKMFAQRAAAGKVELDEQAKVLELTNALLAELKKHVRDVRPMDYTTTRRFLESLACEALQSRS